jgi:hypothetical protein
VDVRELFPDIGLGVLPGDIRLADAQVQLVPVGPGSAVSPISYSEFVEGTGYDARLTVTSVFKAVPVNTYTVAVTIDGEYYSGTGEDVVTVYDPSLGYTSGGGSFVWPGTADSDADYEGDVTTFGYTMEYGKNGKNVRGSLLIIRRLPDGSIYRIKGNAIAGLSLGEEAGFGWASFSGKANYLAPGSEDEGNHEFVIYVEDHGDPGAGKDRIWIQVLDKEDVVIPAMSMSVPAVDRAVSIREGDIFAPRAGSPGKGKNQNSTTFSLTAEGESLIDTSTNEAQLASFEVEDTNRDGNVTALDAIVVVNTISRLEAGAATESAGSPMDVNGDERISAIDALLVINRLSRQQELIAESESFEATAGVPTQMRSYSDSVDAMFSEYDDDDEDDFISLF